MNALVVCSLFWRLGRRGHNREGVIIRSVISVVAGLRQRTLPRRLFFLQPQHVRRAFSPPLLVHSPGSTMLFEAPSNIIENSEELAELWMCLFLASMRVFFFFSPWHRVCRVNQHWITSIIRIIVKAVFKAILMIQCKRLEHRYCWPTGRVAFLQIDFLSNFAVFYFILLFIIFSVTPVIWGTAAKTSYTHTELEGLFFFYWLKEVIEFLKYRIHCFRGLTSVYLGLIVRTSCLLLCSLSPSFSISCESSLISWKCKFKIAGLPLWKRSLPRNHSSPSEPH